MPKQPLKVDQYDPFVEVLLRQDANGRIIFSAKELIRILHKEITAMGLTPSNTADAVQKKLAIIFLTKTIEKDIDLFSVISTIPRNIIEELAFIVKDNSSNDSILESLEELSKKKESLDWVLANTSFVNLVFLSIIELSACMSESSSKKSFFKKLLQKSESLDICKKHETFGELMLSLEERALIIDMSE